MEFLPEEGANGQSAEETVYSLKVEGKKLMFGNKVMAEVVTENSRQVIHLGSDNGNLRIAVIKPLTKQANQSVKKNLEEKAKTTIICVGFYHDSPLLHRAESKMITAASNPSTSSDATGKKKRKIKNQCINKNNSVSPKNKKTKDSQFPTVRNSPWSSSHVLAEKEEIPPEQWGNVASVPATVSQEHAAQQVGVGLGSAANSIFGFNSIIENEQWSSTNGEVGEEPSNSLGTAIMILI